MSGALEPGVGRRVRTLSVSGEVRRASTGLNRLTTPTPSLTPALVATVSATTSTTSTTEATPTAAEVERRHLLTHLVPGVERRLRLIRRCHVVLLDRHLVWLRCDLRRKLSLRLV